MYSREIDGKALTLIPSGWTYERTFVLYDKESGSLWYPDDGRLLCIQGKYFERTLPELPMKDTIWGRWSRKHPNSEFLE